MYASRGTQLVVGLFALAGIVALAYLSLNLGKVEFLTPPSYTLYADFDNVSGLKVGDAVQIAGVPVGKVVSEKLDSVRARVAMRINRGVQIDDKAIASIKSSGIIGDKYLAIALGPGDKTLGEGGVIRQTESSFVLEDAIGQLINNLGSGGGKKDSGSGGKNADDVH